MTLNELKARLEEISIPFRNHSNYYEAIGFQPFLDVAIHRELLKKGWWHTLWLGYSPAGRFYVGLRIFPGKSWKTWPVVIVKDMRRAISHARNLSCASALFIFNSVNSSPKIFANFQGGINLLEQIARPFYQVLEKEEDLEFLIDYLSNDQNKPTEEPEERSFKIQRFITFMSFLDGSDEQNTFFSIVSEMLENKRTIPVCPEQDLGMWETRAANMIAARATIRANELTVNQLAPPLWHSFVQPHGYDANGSHISYYPEYSYEPYMGIREIALLLAASYYSFGNAISQHPLFHAAVALRDRGVNRYNGVEHMEAAALLDEQLQQPVLSWAALVSAAYWSNKNLDQAFPPAWDAAIFLSEKYGWDDTLIALNMQKQVHQE